MSTVDAFSAHQSASLGVFSWAPRSTAVLVIDMVNDFCTAGGAMVLPDSQILYPQVARLTDDARDMGAQIVWVRDEHEPDDREFRKRAVHCLKDSWGAQIVDDLPQRPEDVVRTKHAFSAFYDSDLDDWLRAKGFTQLILCGVVTNICVRSTAHDAFFRGYDLAVASDACMGTGTREHESSLYDIDTHFGQVHTIDEVLAGVTT